jgi:hypothetical protein
MSDFLAGRGTVIICSAAADIGIVNVVSCPACHGLIIYSYNILDANASIG